MVVAVAFATQCMTYDLQ